MATPDTAAALLAELTRQGIELQARGNRLRYRPRAALTPELVEQVRARKSELLSLLAPEDDQTSNRAAQTGPAFRFCDGLMAFGDVCAGWMPAAWAEELRRKADRCDAYRPDVADYYRRWAEDIEQRLKE